MRQLELFQLTKQKSRRTLHAPGGAGTWVAALAEGDASDPAAGSVAPGRPLAVRLQAPVAAQAW